MYNFPGELCFSVKVNGVECSATETLMTSITHSSGTTTNRLTVGRCFITKCDNIHTTLYKQKHLKRNKIYSLPRNLQLRSHSSLLSHHQM